jgi:Predicted ATPases of PP-loop superfamily
MSTKATNREPVILAWSGGKDCTMALREIEMGGEHMPVALLTTVTSGYERISMHGVRRSLLHAQAASLGIPLQEVEISPRADNQEYESKMDAALSALRSTTPAIGGVAFGDLFLEDIRAYRESMLARADLRGFFPLWGRDTSALAAEFTALGFRAVVVCVDSTALDRSFAGREYDTAFVSDLPAGVDPCGENGEFHTFVYDGPLFAHPVAHERGEIVLRDERFVYADLLDPVTSRRGLASGAEAAGR